MTRLFGSFVLAAIAAGALTTAPAASSAVREQRITMTVTNKGFQPAAIRVKAGQPLRLLVTRRTERTCATEIVIAGYGIKTPLPLNRQVEVRFTPKQAGTIRYACAMDMIAGKLVVE